MGYLKSEDTQLYIMNEVLSTCLGTLAFHFANNVTNASNTTSSSSPQSRKRPMTQDSSEVTKTTRPCTNFTTSYPGTSAVDSGLSSFGSTAASDLVGQQKTESETGVGIVDNEYVDNDDDSDIICVKSEPVTHFVRETTTIIQSDPGILDSNPYESSEIIPGLFNEIIGDVKDEEYLSSDGVAAETPPGFPYDDAIDHLGANGHGSRSQQSASSSTDVRYTWTPSARGRPSHASARPRDPNVTEVPLPEISKHLDQYFSCPLCPSAFRCKTNAQRHVKSVHGNMRYACQLCQKTFTRTE